MSSELFIICGPCALENEKHALGLAAELKNITEETGFEMIFKGSFDKANRTSIDSFRGVGIDKGLEILSSVKAKHNLRVVTDIHLPSQAQKVAEVVDVLQIPAFLCRQTDLLVETGKTGKDVIIKKGQFLAASDMQYAAKKVESGNQDSTIFLCERGTCFGYRDLVVDFRSLKIMKDLGYPVIFDATHSIQNMGGAGGKSSGDKSFISSLAKAAVAVGIDALFLECHQEPEKAPSDGPNMLDLKSLKSLLSNIRKIADLNLSD